MHFWEICIRCVRLGFPSYNAPCITSVAIHDVCIYLRQGLIRLLHYWLLIRPRNRLQSTVERNLVDRIGFPKRGPNDLLQYMRCSLQFLSLWMDQAVGNKQNCQLSRSCTLNLHFYYNLLGTDMFT